MLRQHHRLNGHESEQTLRDSKGQESLACCSPWGHEESDTAQRMSSHSQSCVCVNPNLPPPSAPAFSLRIHASVLSVCVCFCFQSLRKASVLPSDLIMCFSPSRLLPARHSDFEPKSSPLTLETLYFLLSSAQKVFLLVRCMAGPPHFGNRLQYPSLPRVLT